MNPDRWDARTQTRHRGGPEHHAVSRLRQQAARRPAPAATTEPEEYARAVWAHVLDTLTGDDTRLRTALEVAASRANPDDLRTVASELRSALADRAWWNATRLEQLVAGYVVTRRDPTPGRQVLRGAVVGILNEPTVQRRLNARALDQLRTDLLPAGYVPTPSRSRSRRRR